MAKFTIEIETNGAAFGDDTPEGRVERALELARILKQVAHDLETVNASRTALHDYNGNRCGVTKWAKD